MKDFRQGLFRDFFNDNIFDVSVSNICRYKNVLVIVNPPWATNSSLDYNLPQKTNFKELKGIEVDWFF